LIQFLLDFQGIANQLPDNIMAAEGWYNRIVRPPNAFPDAIDGLAPATACKKGNRMSLLSKQPPRRSPAMRNRFPKSADAAKFRGWPLSLTLPLRRRLSRLALCPDQAA